jgi:hypothetical protein
MEGRLDVLAGAVSKTSLLLRPLAPSLTSSGEREEEAGGWGAGAEKQRTTGEETDGEGRREKKEKRVGSWRWWNRIYDCWDRVRVIKDNECESSRYKGENLVDRVGIFCFEGGNGG